MYQKDFNILTPVSRVLLLFGNPHPIINVIMIINGLGVSPHRLPPAHTHLLLYSHLFYFLLCKPELATLWNLKSYNTQWVTISTLSFTNIILKCIKQPVCSVDTTWTLWGLIFVWIVQISGEKIIQNTPQAERTASPFCSKVSQLTGKKGSQNKPVFQFHKDRIILYN